MSERIAKDKVMIACVVGEVTLIVQPAIDNHIDRIHLIHYVKQDEEKNDRALFYQSFYDAVYSKLHDDAHIDVEEHSDAETYIFRKMMSKIYEILFNEVVLKKSYVYVNLSGGTSEYAAAAAICSMMFKDVEIFTASIGHEDRVIDYDQLKKNAMKGTELVGSCSKVGHVYPVEKFPIDRPNENLLRAFRIYAVISDSDYRNSNSVVIRNLILQNVWLAKGPLHEGAAVKGTSVELERPDKGYACPKSKESKYLSRQRGEAVQYYRVYISQWLEKGWIEKVERSKKYKLTDEGKTVLEVFCPPRVIDFGIDDIAIQETKYFED